MLSFLYTSNLVKTLHEDTSILVLDKPAGMPSVSLKEGEEGTIAAWILKKFPGQDQIGKNGALEAGLVHRLDNDTSGVIVAARTKAAYENLRAQFDEGCVWKEYTALVLGTPPPNGAIDSPIAHHPRKKKKMVVCASKAEAEKLKARPAHTEYEVIRQIKDYSLLKVTIATGVRHQIRAHLASIGFPIAGDRLYQNPKMRAKDSSNLTRHFLHAHKLQFRHPESGCVVEFSSDLPEDLKEMLATCSG